MAIYSHLKEEEEVGQVRWRGRKETKAGHFRTLKRGEKKGGWPFFFLREKEEELKQKRKETKTNKERERQVWAAFGRV